MIDGQSQSLDEIRLLADLSPDERSALAKRCSWRSYPAHEQIIDRQSDSRDVFFIVSGKVQVVNYSLSGREISFDDLSGGHYIGELAAIDSEPRSANVVALEPTVIASLGPAAFLEVLGTHPGMAITVMRRLAQIVRQSTERIMDLSTLGANNRVHAELLRLARENMVGEERALLDPIPVHSDIASRVSTTRETVARVFSDLSRQGIATRDGNALTVADVTRLEDMVEEVRGE